MTLEEAIEQIAPLDVFIQKKSVEKWDNIAKPLKSLGRLEEMVVQLCGITKSLNPRVDRKAVVVMCADNGVVEEGVTQTGSEVTSIVAENFVKGIATINSFSRVCGADVFAVDIGINRQMQINGLYDRKIAFGTNNFTKMPAMTKEQAICAIETGIDFVSMLKKEGYQLVATGEMGIGNTTTSSAVISVLTGIEPELVTGRGAGLSKEGLKRKIKVIKEGIKANKPDKDDVLDVVSKLGGYDICGMIGCFIGGAVNRIPVIIDGFISAVAANCAIRLAPLCRDYMFASHCSAEPAGKLALDAIGIKPYIDCGMCLGEGTGAVIGAKLFDFALAAYNEIVGFDEVSFERYIPLE
ncbi:MAG: nicotinate-nucleotide--dimethylbenzimidazole phosphoribosyltransferase [Clostridia bacterium]|nr:nicotinate-nucleotide--dimethylbenzimidazole phosphoribosyltransferase [Clostridia bacterium]